MGAVTFSIDLRLVRSLKNALPLTVFVETGTFEGGTLEAVQGVFAECFSVELSETAAAAAREKLRQFSHVKIEHGSSPEFLEKLRAELAEKAVLYWLDAHWCEGDDTAGQTSQCPLLDELRAIGQLNSESVVLIDDARLFLAPPPAPHEVAQWPRFQQVVEALGAISPEHELMILNDVILFFPRAISAAVGKFAYRHGVDWLALTRAAGREAIHLKNTAELREYIAVLEETVAQEKAKRKEYKVKIETQREKLEMAKTKIEKLKAEPPKKPRGWWPAAAAPDPAPEPPAKKPKSSAPPAPESPAPGPPAKPRQIWTEILELSAARPPAVLFDIGANEGQTMRQLAETFPEARIHSFEPFPAAFAKLQQNAVPFPQVHTHGLALGERDGETTLFLSQASVTNSLLPTAATAAEYSPAGWTDPAGIATVPISTLDSFCAREGIKTIDVLKVDAQGYEAKILQGASGLLASGSVRFVYLEVIFVPLYEGQSSFEDLYGFLRGHGYRFVDFFEKDAAPDGTLRWCNALFRAGSEAANSTAPGQ